MNYLLIKTADMHAEIVLMNEQHEVVARDEWDAGRQLARDLLSRLDQLLATAEREWDEVSGVGIYKGPGSFTSLRIGITTANTIAYAKSVAVVGTSGDTWREDAIERLVNGDDDKLVMPDYGADPHITPPRK